MKKHKGDCLPVAILGAGGTSLYMADCIMRSNTFAFAGFLDDDEIKQAQGYEGLPVLGNLNSWKALDDNILFISSLYGVKKMEYFHRLVASLGIPDERWATVVDPRATVCTGAKIAGGAFVGAGSVVEPAAVIGTRCALLGNVYVAHHSALEDYVVCANSVSIAGGVHVGAGSFIGANATIHQFIKIGPLAVIGMAAVVLESVAAGLTVVGNPAKPLMPKSSRHDEAG